MDPAASTFEYLNSPESVFLDSADLLALQFPSGSQSSSAQSHSIRDHIPCPSYSPRHWTISGCSAGGTSLFTIPSFIGDPPPLRLHTHIPDLYSQPPRIRAHFSSPTLCHTPINKTHPLRDQVLRALDRWTETTEGAAEKLLALPFGSLLLIPEIHVDVSAMNVFLVPDYSMEIGMRSVGNLIEQWKNAGVPGEQIPAALDIEDLVIDNQLHDSVGMVHLRSRGNINDQWAFKSAVQGYEPLYHEIQVLLNLPDHRNVLGKPKYVVTKRCCFGGKLGVCGFLVKFYELGSLASNISDMRMVLGDMELLGIVRQICKALVFLMSNGAHLPDIRTDNILLENSDTGITPVLIDFEEGKNWYSWSPPEIYFHDYLDELLEAESTPEGERQRYQALHDSIQAIHPTAAVPRNWNSSYRGEESCAWRSLSVPEREAAAVYLFGKLTWCIFEGCRSVSRVDESFWHPPGTRNDLEIEFPTFRRTPLPIRVLILRCTSGSPEIEGRLPATKRVDGKIYARDNHRWDARIEGGHAGAALYAARAWWGEELGRMEAFWCAPREFERGTLVPRFKRPSLREVLTCIESISRETS